MPVLLIAESDLPEEANAGIADKMTPVIRAAKGLICHAGRPNPAGRWRVIEIWESEEDGQTGPITTSSPTCHQLSSRRIRTTRFAPQSPGRPPPQRAGGEALQGLGPRRSQTLSRT